MTNTHAMASAQSTGWMRLLAKRTDARPEFTPDATLLKHADKQLRFVRDASGDGQPIADTRAAAELLDHSGGELPRSIRGIWQLADELAGGRSQLQMVSLANDVYGHAAAIYGAGLLHTTLYPGRTAELPPEVIGLHLSKQAKDLGGAALGVTIGPTTTSIALGPLPSSVLVRAARGERTTAVERALAARTTTHEIAHATTAAPGVPKHVNEGVAEVVARHPAIMRHALDVLELDASDDTLSLATAGHAALLAEVHGSEFAPTISDEGYANVRTLLSRAGQDADEEVTARALAATPVSTLLDRLAELVR